ncbi:MAG: Mu-like prophage major head subunit gpT family protein, partial [Planctomycetaceae bacterium]|nr:Mu-like prophage major head subunit gpT family protein [Planctomycetaceae bacterium]
LEGNVIDGFQKQFRAAAVMETNRIESIRKIGNGEQPDLQAKAIREGWTADQFELQFLRSARPIMTTQRNEPQRPMQLVLEAIAMQAGGLSLQAMEKRYSEPVLEAAERYRGIRLLEFCDLAHGTPLPRFSSQSCEWLQAAFSTTSLPGILTNLANKMLLEGYNYIDDSWRRICKTASVNNFQQHTRYRMIGSFTFEQVGEGGELKHGKLSEQKFTQQAKTYGIMFGLSREMIVNDDLSALTDVPRNVGLGAGEAITDKVWQLLLSNPPGDNGVAFFHESHKNYQEGAGTALNVDGLTLAEIAFMEQTKPNGRPLGLPASILLVPTALKVVAEMLMKAVTLNETTPENKPKPVNNPHTGKYEVVSTPYLSSAGFKNSSAKAWYLFADPNRVPALEVAFLGGQDRPTVERADADFNTLGFQFRGYLDFGVKEQDYRGALKMKGEV